MRPIIYHVATTLDGFIAHPDGSIGGFLSRGEHVDDYLQHLQDYDTVIMGRKTYEFGYQYGLEPGQPAYSHMQHYVFSRTLRFDNPHEQVKVVSERAVDFIRDLKETAGSPVYLCGGGAFAGFLLRHGLIDELILKQNPVVFGRGIPLFGEDAPQAAFSLCDWKSYPNGVLLLKYKLVAV